jgi:transketolase
MDNTFLQKRADTIRFLAADMIQRANSGHPGAPMGMADIATVLSDHIKLDPNNTDWLNRDRLVFSGGHATGLVYSLLHLWGFDVSIEDMKNFRQLGSKTPGHPEYGHTSGIEITTGPLGQGISNAVGFAMASKYAKNVLNSETAEIIDHQVFCLCGDGDLQEGISYEACALASVQKLDNLVIIYDSNNITIEGDTSLAWDEDVKKRFEALNFNVLEIDGHDFAQIDEALNSAKNGNKPTMIIANTLIAKGSATMVGSHKSHGAPLGDDDIKQSKINAGFDGDKSFAVDSDVKESFDKTKSGEELSRAWNKRLLDLPLKEQNAMLESLLNPDFSKVEYPKFELGSKVATRDSNGKIINSIAKSYSGFIGGSADLAPSNKTELTGLGDFPNGRNIHFGIREHAMARIVNAMNLYGLFRVFSSTFFVFSDYLKPSARIASLSNIPHHFIWTHDSIGVGEDGPTHQPIEHLSQFRALPNFYVFRPADANENIACWQIALNLKAPSGFVCSRQGLEVFNSDIPDISKGAYIVKEVANPTHTLIATGSEVGLALEVAKDKDINVVSVPCYDILCEQSKEGIDKIINPNSKRVAIEASRGLEWYRFADEVISMDSFGASGNANDLFDYFGFTKEKILAKI